VTYATEVGEFSRAGRMSMVARRRRERAPDGVDGQCRLAGAAPVGRHRPDRTSI